MNDVERFDAFKLAACIPCVRASDYDALKARLEEALEALRLCLDAIDDYDAESPEGSEVYAQAANKARAVLKERP